MKKITVQAFKDQSNIEMIVAFMEANNGYITSKIITDLGIHRMYLNILCEKKIIEKVGKGIYIDSKTYEDSYYVLNLENPNIVFSHMTALYFHGLSIKAPTSSYDITVISKYHNPKIRNHNIFYVAKDKYNIGLTEVITPMGNKVRSYDAERCICDIIRSKKRMDTEHIKFSVKEYLKSKNKNLTKLSEYAQIFGIQEEVMNFVSIMYE